MRACVLNTRTTEETAASPSSLLLSAKLNPHQSTDPSPPHHTDHSAQALQRFVCASVFPECPHDGFGVPFKPVCRPTCREAEAACGVPLSCDFLQSSDCTATPTAAADGMGGLEEGFFLLKDDQGPYEPLPYLYGALLAVWTALSLVWLFNVRTLVPAAPTRVIHIHTHAYSPDPPKHTPHPHPHPAQICRPHATSSGQRHRPASRLCTILTCVPLAKVAMMLLSLSFWSTCVTWGVCSFWMGVSLINCQLLYETFSLVGFVLIAKGWCITRPGFHPHEWRTVIVLMCAFYLASSSLLLVRRVRSRWMLLSALHIIRAQRLTMRPPPRN